MKEENDENIATADKLAEQFKVSPPTHSPDRCEGRQFPTGKTRDRDDGLRALADQAAVALVSRHLPKTISDVFSRSFRRLSGVDADLPETWFSL